jgi:16S rRNA processing protein RimM
VHGRPPLDDGGTGHADGGDADGDAPPGASDNVPPGASDTVPHGASDTVPHGASDDVPPGASEGVPDDSGSGSGSVYSNPKSPMLLVGHIVKPHGLQGDVIVSLVTNREERVATGSVLGTDRGGELTVLRSSPHQRRFIVTFDGVVGIQDAERLRGTQLLARPLEDPDALWVHELIGARVEDTEGRVLGTVEGVEANPASDLMILDGGALIPLRFVVESEPGERVTVEIPDGLLDLS